MMQQKNTLAVTFQRCWALPRALNPLAIGIRVVFSNPLTRHGNDDDTGGVIVILARVHDGSGAGHVGLPALASQGVTAFIAPT